ncbi:hypothetical protein CS542_08035 [Pedobacter sp. IW39]|nr:hypothetical protein CS542_08035 [Pedobacter sp. IW39]
MQHQTGRSYRSQRYHSGINRFSRNRRCCKTRFHRCLTNYDLLGLQFLQSILFAIFPKFCCRKSASCCVYCYKKISVGFNATFVSLMF